MIAHSHFLSDWHEVQNWLYLKLPLIEISAPQCIRMNIIFIEKGKIALNLKQNAILVTKKINIEITTFWTWDRLNLGLGLGTWNLVWLDVIEECQ